MSCKDCGCNKSSEQSLVEETNNLSVSDRPECACSAKTTAKSCCSSNSCCQPSRPNNRGCSCCCRSCCACCRCCSRSSRDFCQDRRIESRASGNCSCCNKRKEEEVKSTGCACSHKN